MSFAFNIFVPISVQEMVYLKAIQKSTPIGVSVSGTIDQKTHLKKVRGGFSPLSPPLDPPMFGAYRIRCIWGKTAFSGIHELCECF